VPSFSPRQAGRLIVIVIVVIVVVAVTPAPIAALLKVIGLIGMPAPIVAAPLVVVPRRMSCRRQVRIRIAERLVVVVIVARPATVPIAEVPWMDAGSVPISGFHALVPSAATAVVVTFIVGQSHGGRQR